MPLPYSRAAVGSTNPAKLEAVHRALARLAPGCTVEGVAVPSGVGAQPFGDEETRMGAMRRAQTTLAVSDADVAFGLEGGVIFEDGRPWLVSWVAAIDREGRSGEASGLRMALPYSAAARLRAGDELGDVIDDLFSVHLSKQHTGAIGLLTEGFVSRTDAFADLVAMACAPLIRPDLYPGSSLPGART
jgi:inosine/xanthosine triphosphatase